MTAKAEAALQEVPLAEPATGRVVALYVASRAGDPVQARVAVNAIAGVGLTGDRYATGTGNWSDPRWPDQQLTLVEEEVAEDLGLPPALLRRNVLTRGVRLTHLIGARFQIGGAQLLGVRVCDPCVYLEQLIGRAGLRRDLERAGGGLRAAVLTGGRMAIGDLVIPIGNAAAETIPG